MASWALCRRAEVLTNKHWLGATRGVVSPIHNIAGRQRTVTARIELYCRCPQVLRNMQSSSKLKYKGSIYPVHRLARQPGALAQAISAATSPPRTPHRSLDMQS